MWCDRGANYGRHNGDHIALFKCIKSTWCVPSIYMMFCIKYISAPSTLHTY